MIFLPSTSRDSKLKIIAKALKWGVGVGGAFEMGCFFFFLVWTEMMGKILKIGRIL